MDKVEEMVPCRCECGGGSCELLIQLPIEVTRKVIKGDLMVISALCRVELMETDKFVEAGDGYLLYKQEKGDKVEEV